MTIDAIALLRLSHSQLESALRVADVREGATFFRATGRTLEARALDDGTTLGLAAAVRHP